MLSSPLNFEKATGLHMVGRLKPASYRAWVSRLAGSLLVLLLLMLIVACANVTNLLLGLSTSRCR